MLIHYVTMSIRLVSEDSPLQCKVIPVTHVAQNCSVIWCTQTMRGAIIDPGGEIDRVRAFIDEQGVEVERLLVTHGHPDHAGAAAAFATVLNVPIEGPHRAEAELISTNMCSIAATHGFSDCEPYSPDRWLADGDIVPVGNQQLVMLHCPGHTDGHAAYFSEAARLAFVGDIVFKNDIGASSGPENYFTLLHSIREKLFPLGDDVVFVPGHHTASTFGAERVFNPYVSDFAAEDYEHLFDDPRFAHRPE
jgi:hydroxyacylglutathione hydrolase